MTLPQATFVPDIAVINYDWQPLEAHKPGPSDSVRRWLQDQGSLTRQLIALSGNEFQVRLETEAWITLDSTNLRSQFGPVPQSHRFWSRKVTLLGRGEQWVAAHTLIPEHSFCSPLQQVLNLQNKPLGEFLFSHPGLVRSDMDFTPADEQGWGRRSLFFLFQKPVMVAEFFLPALLHAIERTQSIENNRS